MEPILDAVALYAVSEQFARSACAGDAVSNHQWRRSVCLSVFGSCAVYAGADGLTRTPILECGHVECVVLFGGAHFVPARSATDVSALR